MVCAQVASTAYRMHVRESHREDIHIIICVCVFFLSRLQCIVAVCWLSDVMSVNWCKYIDKMLMCVYLCVLLVRPSKFVFHYYRSTSVIIIAPNVQWIGSNIWLPVWPLALHHLFVTSFTTPFRSRSFFLSLFVFDFFLASFCFEFLQREQCIRNENATA